MQYGGIDAHKTYLTVAVVDKNGPVLGRLRGALGVGRLIVGAFHRKAAGLIPAPYVDRAFRLGLAAAAGVGIGLWVRGIAPWLVAGAFSVVAFAGPAAVLALVRRRDLDAVRSWRAPETEASG